MPTTSRAPLNAAAIARTPDRCRCRARVGPATSSAESSRKHIRVVGWWPVPNPIDGSITITVASGAGGREVPWRRDDEPAGA